MSNVPTANVASLLLELEKFSSFYTEELQTISQYLSRQPFLTGDLLMKQGEQGNCLGIVLKGTVNIANHGIVSVTRTAGDLLGEMALVRSEPRIADVVAVSDGEWVVLHFDDLEALQHSHPHTAVKLFGVLTESTAQKLREMETRDPNAYVVLMADEAKRSDLVDFVLKNQSNFSNCAIATQPPLNQLLEKETAIAADKILDAQYLVWGDASIGSLIVSGNILAILYLRDPLALMPNQQEFEALLRLCDANQVPFATNFATADAIMNTLGDSL